MTLRGVIFDMGGTLLHYHPPDSAAENGWQDMENAGADDLRAFLHAQGYDVPPVETARETNMAIMEKHWRRVIRREPVNPQLRPILAEVMTVWGIPEAAITDELLNGAVAAYVTTVQRDYVRPVDGAHETLEKLRERGLRLGLISNTVWPGDLHRADLDRWDLAGYLECAFFSADEGAWKPGAAIFNRALAALDLQPDEAAYVGDSLYFDVYGAQQAGLRGIWVGGDWRTPDDLHITPDVTLARLPDLLEVIASWR